MKGFAYILALATAPPLFCLTPPPGESIAGRVAWLKTNSKAIRSIDPQDNDYSDLRALTQSIGTSRIVLLGGSSEAPAVKAKFRLVRFLHEELGFDVLASSMPFLSLLEAEELDEAFDRRKLVLTIGHFVPQAFAIRDDRRASSHSDILDYIHATHRGDHPLHLAGFGTSIFPDMQTDYPKRLFQWIDRIDPKLCPSADRKAIKAMLLPDRPGAPWTDARAAVRRLDDKLAHLPATGPNARELSFYRQTLANLVSQFTARYGQRVTSRVPELVVWYAKEWRPESRIIIWSDNTWIARNLAGPRRPDGRTSTLLTVGSSISREFGTAAYSIGFSENPAYHNQLLDVVVAGPAVDDVESLFHAAGTPYSFVDFRSLPQDHWLRRPLNGRFRSRGDSLTWPEIYDGMISIDRTLTSDDPPKGKK